MTQICQILTFPGPSCRPIRIFMVQNGWHRCPSYSTTYFMLDPHLNLQYTILRTSIILTNLIHNLTNTLHKAIRNLTKNEFDPVAGAFWNYANLWWGCGSGRPMSDASIPLKVTRLGITPVGNWRWCKRQGRLKLSQKRSPHIFNAILDVCSEENGPEKFTIMAKSCFGKRRDVFCFS